MGRITMRSADRLFIVEAGRLIHDAQPVEPAVDIYVSHLGPDGEPAPDAEVLTVQNNDARRAGPWIASDMPVLFVQLNITPRYIYRPSVTDFASHSDATQYTISHGEFVRLAEAYGHEVVVEDGGEPASDISADAEKAEKAQRREKASTMQDRAIIAALDARNIDPLTMETAPMGNKPWPLRDEIGEELKLSRVVMKKAFARLRNAGLMKRA